MNTHFFNCHFFNAEPDPGSTRRALPANLKFGSDRLVTGTGSISDHPNVLGSYKILSGKIQEFVGMRLEEVQETY